MIGRLVLGRYRIARALAKGGMGVVYLARSEGASGFSKPVVVKRMLTDLVADQHMARMFVREARLMSRLRHPGLVGVIDFGEERGDYLMIIEYVHGFHLGQWHRYVRQTDGFFPANAIVHIMATVLDSLHYAHNLADEDGRALNIVHRDVSPSNILIDVEGHVKLADFGVARSRDQTEQTEETTIKGKMPYLAPELFRLEDPTPSSDAYACGVVLHELLVGRNEFRAQDMAQTVSRVLEHTPTPPHEVREDLPDGLSEVLQRGLAKKPDERFPNAMEFSRALRALLPGSESELQARVLERIRKDFLNPKMPTLLRMPTLSELENSWRNPPKQTLGVPPPPSDLMTPFSSAPPTTVHNPGTGGNESSGGAKPLIWIGVAIVVLLAAGVGTTLGLLQSQDKKDDPKRTYVVVQPQDQAAQPVPGPTEPGDQADEPKPEPARARPTSIRRRPRTSSKSLASPFNARRTEVMGCFRTHGTPAEGSVTVGFTLETSGNVRAVRIDPATVRGTALGNCVLKIAKSTRFDQRDEPITFSIPIRVRTKPAG